MLGGSGHRPLDLRQTTISELAWEALTRAAAFTQRAGSRVTGACRSGHHTTKTGCRRQPVAEVRRVSALGTLLTADSVQRPPAPAAEPSPICCSNRLRTWHRAYALSLFRDIFAGRFLLLARRIGRSPCPSLGSFEKLQRLGEALLAFPVRRPGIHLLECQIVARRRDGPLRTALELRQLFPGHRHRDAETRSGAR